MNLECSSIHGGIVMAGKPSKRQDTERRTRIAAARAAAARAERRATLLRRGGIAIAGAVTAGVIVAVALHSASGAGASKGAGNAALPNSPVVTGAGLPPWPAPADASAGAKAAGLRMGEMEGTALHFHTHLDVFVDGAPVPVPADLGIDLRAGVLSELHTHDTTGVLHVEAPDVSHRYVLGQLFSEWNVRLDAAHLGGLTATPARTLIAYVDGKRVTGDPAQIELRAHREIALVFGGAGTNPIPSRYTFPDGE
jgi:hypothetical protein